MRDFKKIIRNHKDDLSLFFAEFRNTFGEEADKFEWFTASELAYKMIMAERSKGLITNKERHTKLSTLYHDLQTTVAAYQLHGEFTKKNSIKDVFLSLIDDTAEDVEVTPIVDEIGLRAMRRNMHEICAKAKLTADKGLVVESLNLFQELDLYQSQSNTDGFDSNRKLLKTLHKSISDLEKRIDKVNRKRDREVKAEVLKLLKGNSVLDIKNAYNLSRTVGFRNDELEPEIGLGMSETKKMIIKESLKTFLNTIG